MVTRFEPLGNGMTIEVSKDYAFGEDALLLAQFAAPRETDRVCDLGTGCGILPLLWCREHPRLHIEAIEIQAEAAALTRRSVERCGLSGAVRVHTADLREWKEVLRAGSQDVVTMNPPYFTAQSGGVSRSEAARIARHEGAGCTLEDAVGAASGLLRAGGRFCLCHRPERLCDVFVSLRAAELEPKRLRFIQAGTESAPWLFLCEAVKGAGSGLKMMPPFCQKDKDGGPSKEYLGLYSPINKGTDIL